MNKQEEEFEVLGHGGQMENMPPNQSDQRRGLDNIITNKQNRPVLRMDVTYAEHSHIIGKGGNNVRQISEETRCHIHFPDENRTVSVHEKSNLVTITGPVPGIEKARQRVRVLLPVNFQFDIPVEGHPIPHPNQVKATLESIQKSYRITANIITRPSGIGSAVLVRGPQFPKTLNGVEAVMRYFAPTTARRLKVTMNIEIPPTHQSFMMNFAYGQDRLAEQGKRWNTQIKFPDPVQGHGNTTVNIIGSPRFAFATWLELQKMLPVQLIFEIPGDIKLSSEEVSNTANELNVGILTRSKPKSDFKSVTIRSYEGNIYNVYEARRRLLNLPIPEVTRDMMANDDPPAFVMESETFPEEQEYGNFPQVFSPGFVANPGYGGAIQTVTPVPYNGSVFVFPGLGMPHAHPNNHQHSHNRNLLHPNMRNEMPAMDDCYGQNYIKIYNNNGYQKENCPSLQARIPKRDGDGRESRDSAVYLPPPIANSDDGEPRESLSRATEESGRQSGNDSECVNDYPLSHPRIELEGETKRESNTLSTWGNQLFPKIGDMIPYEQDTFDRGLNTSPYPYYQTPGACPSSWSDIVELLNNEGISYVIELFTQHDIDRGLFLSLNDQDLKEIGVDSFGARKKLTKIIQSINNSNNPCPDFQNLTLDSTQETNDMLHFTDENLEEIELK